MFKQFAVATILSANVVLGQSLEDGTSKENAVTNFTFDDGINTQRIAAWFSEESGEYRFNLEIETSINGIFGREEFSNTKWQEHGVEIGWCMGGMSSALVNYSMIWDCVTIEMDQKDIGKVNKITDQYAFTEDYDINAVLKAKEDDSIPDDVVKVQGLPDGNTFTWRLDSQTADCYPEEKDCPQVVQTISRPWYTEEPAYDISLYEQEDQPFVDYFTWFKVSDPKNEIVQMNQSSEIEWFFPGDWQYIFTASNSTSTSDVTPFIPCEDGLFWDENSQTCVDLSDLFDQDLPIAVPIANDNNGQVENYEDYLHDYAMDLVIQADFYDPIGQMDSFEMSSMIRGVLEDEFVQGIFTEEHFNEDFYRAINMKDALSEGDYYDNEAPVKAMVDFINNL